MPSSGNMPWLVKNDPDRYYYMKMQWHQEVYQHTSMAINAALTLAMIFLPGVGLAAKALIYSTVILDVFGIAVNTVGYDHLEPQAAIQAAMMDHYHKQENEQRIKAHEALKRKDPKHTWDDMNEPPGNTDIAELAILYGHEAKLMEQQEVKDFIGMSEKEKVAKLREISDNALTEFKTMDKGVFVQHIDGVPINVNDPDVIRTVNDDYPEGVWHKDDHTLGYGDYRKSDVDVKNTAYFENLTQAEKDDFLGQAGTMVNDFYTMKRQIQSDVGELRREFLAEAIANARAAGRDIVLPHEPKGDSFGAWENYHKRFYDAVEDIVVTDGKQSARHPWLSREFGQHGYNRTGETKVGTLEAGANPTDHVLAKYNAEVLAARKAYGEGRTFISYKDAKADAQAKGQQFNSKTNSLQSDMNYLITIAKDFSAKLAKFFKDNPKYLTHQYSNQYYKAKMDLFAQQGYDLSSVQNFKTEHNRPFSAFEAMLKQHGDDPRLRNMQNMFDTNLYDKSGKYTYGTWDAKDWTVEDLDYKTPEANVQQLRNFMRSRGGDISRVNGSNRGIQTFTAPQTAPAPEQLKRKRVARRSANIF